MKRLLPLLLMGPLLAACEQQVVVRQSTLASQFEEFNKNGWQVARNDQTKSDAPSDDPNVRVIREADFTKMRFNTNFQVDDPNIPPGAYTGQSSFNRSPSSGQPAPAQPGMNPFGAVPTTPGP